MRRFVHAVMLMILLGIAPGAQAILTIEITQGVAGALPIVFNGGGHCVQISAGKDFLHILTKGLCAGCRCAV